MNRHKESFSERMYRALLRLFPFDFRGEFGSEMEQAFREQRAHVARRAGNTGLMRLWGETIVGIFTTAPVEHVSILHQDVRYALRMMRKNIGYTAAATITLGLGIGANTAIVSVIDAVLLRPLPYQQDDQLVVLHQRADKLGFDMGFSVKEMNDYKQQTASFSQLVEYHSMDFTLFAKNEATRVRTGVVSAGFFRMLGVRPILGRDLRPADDLADAPAVLLLSYEYWKQHLGGDPNVIGKTFEMNDRVHTVAGVLPPVPQYPNENDVYMPTSACPYRSSPGTIESRDARMVRLFGRLKPGVTLDQSRADLTLAAARMQHEYPRVYPKSMGFTASSGLLRKELTTRAKPTLLLLLGAAGCVLLIACANVANMTLARMSARERELVVRSALGAGRSRLLRQLVTESLLMGILAAVLGVAFASQSLRLLVEFLSRLTSRAREIHIDASMLLFALTVAFATSIVFGSVAALYSRYDLAGGLKEGAAYSTAGRRRRRARSVLVVCQVAFSFVLLIGAGLMLRSFAKLQGVDLGFVPQRVLAMNINMNWTKYKNHPERVLEVSNRLLEKVRSQNGVISAAVASSFPLDPNMVALGGMARDFLVEGYALREGETPPVTATRIVSPDYFKTLGIPLLRGRTFTNADNDDAPLVAIINQSAAHHYWRNEDPIGKRVSFDEAEHWFRVVGIVGDVKEFGLNREAGDEVYASEAQSPQAGSVLVRTVEDPLSLAKQLRQGIREVDPQTAIPNVETLEQARTDVLASPRVMTSLLGIFAMLALVIAAAGIGGMLALNVSQRWNEIGIRMALGAKPSTVFGMIFRQGMGLVVIGLALGLASALALTRLMRTLLFQVEPTDMLTYASVAGMLAATALAACYVPARRALRVDPVLALRQE
jgi:putative ABC transport system permease protein